MKLTNNPDNSQNFYSEVDTVINTGGGPVHIHMDEKVPSKSPATRIEVGNLNELQDAIRRRGGTAPEHGPDINDRTVVNTVQWLSNNDQGRFLSVHGPSGCGKSGMVGVALEKWGGRALYYTGGDIEEILDSVDDLETARTIIIDNLHVSNDDLVKQLIEKLNDSPIRAIFISWGRNEVLPNSNAIDISNRSQDEAEAAINTLIEYVNKNSKHGQINIDLKAFEMLASFLTENPDPPSLRTIRALLLDLIYQEELTVGIEEVNKWKDGPMKRMMSLLDMEDSVFTGCISLTLFIQHCGGQISKELLEKVNTEFLHILLQKWGAYPKSIEDDDGRVLGRRIVLSENWSQLCASLYFDGPSIDNMFWGVFDVDWFDRENLQLLSQKIKLARVAFARQAAKFHNDLLLQYYDSSERDLGLNPVSLAECILYEQRDEVSFILTEKIYPWINKWSDKRIKELLYVLRLDIVGIPRGDYFNAVYHPPRFFSDTGALFAYSMNRCVKLLDKITEDGWIEDDDNIPIYYPLARSIGASISHIYGRINLALIQLGEADNLNKLDPTIHLNHAGICYHRSMGEIPPELYHDMAICLMYLDPNSIHHVNNRRLRDEHPRSMRRLMQGMINTPQPVINAFDEAIEKYQERNDPEALAVKMDKLFYIGFAGDNLTEKNNDLVTITIPRPQAFWGKALEIIEEAKDVGGHLRGRIHLKAFRILIASIKNEELFDDQRANVEDARKQLKEAQIHLNRDYILTSILVYEACTCDDLFLGDLTHSAPKDSVTPSLMLQNSLNFSIGIGYHPITGYGKIPVDEREKFKEFYLKLKKCKFHDNDRGTINMGHRLQLLSGVANHCKIDGFDEFITEISHELKRAISSVIDDSNQEYFDFYQTTPKNILNYSEFILACLTKDYELMGRVIDDYRNDCSYSKEKPGRNIHQLFKFSSFDTLVQSILAAWWHDEREHAIIMIEIFSEILDSSYAMNANRCNEALWEIMGLDDDRIVGLLRSSRSNDKIIQILILRHFGSMMNFHDDSEKYSLRCGQMEDTLRKFEYKISDFEEINNQLQYLFYLSTTKLIGQHNSYPRIDYFIDLLRNSLDDFENESKENLFGIAQFELAFVWPNVNQLPDKWKSILKDQIHVGNSALKKQIIGVILRETSEIIPLMRAELRLKWSGWKVLNMLFDLRVEEENRKNPFKN